MSATVVADVLPDQDHLDGLDGRLASLAEAMDGLMLVSLRAGLARTRREGAPTEEDEAAEDRKLARLAEQWPGRLAELDTQLEATRKWVRSELRQARAR